MLSNNALRVIAINSVGDFILFLGKAGVVASVVFIGIEMIKVLICFHLRRIQLSFISFCQGKPGVVYIWTPILIAAIFAYLIAHCFISVYEVNKQDLLYYLHIGDILYLGNLVIYIDVHRYNFHMLLRRL